MFCVLYTYVHDYVHDEQYPIRFSSFVHVFSSYGMLHEKVGKTNANSHDTIMKQ